ncbi:HypC/HybG/HupF family hydrogenase formation chaperone [Methylibium sp.]|uniref:HypC/HybG/HupF family hydrogenase formation chaperone n=1 Tax=Methylibium sp. TaxID=2067992 RepID=UPI003D14193D
MCIGLPMQVLLTEPGHAQCRGRGELRRVRTALVGDVAPGEWLLVFLDSAQERLTPDRAQEIEATLDLLEAVMRGDASQGDAAFVLPSQMNREQVLAMAGAAASPPLEKLT